MLGEVQYVGVCMCAWEWCGGVLGELHRSVHVCMGGVWRCVRGGVEECV